MKKYIRCFEKIKETVFESRKGVGKIIKLTDHWGYPAYILFDVNGDYVDRDIDPNKLHRKLWDMKPQVVDIESSTSIKCSGDLKSGASIDMANIIYDTLFRNTQFEQFDPDICVDNYIDVGASEIVFDYMGHVYKVKVSCID